MTKNDAMEGTKRLMVALGRMPPKQHSEMKLGKPKGNPPKSPKRKAVKPVKPVKPAKA